MITVVAVGQKIDWRERSKKPEAETTSWPSQEMIQAYTKGQGVGMKKRELQEGSVVWTSGTEDDLFLSYTRLAVQRNPWCWALLYLFPRKLSGLP